MRCCKVSGWGSWAMARDGCSLDPYEVQQSNMRGLDKSARRHISVGIMREVGGPKERVTWLAAQSMDEPRGTRSTFLRGLVL